MLLRLTDYLLVSDDQIRMAQANGMYGMIWLKDNQVPVETTREAFDEIVKQLKLRQVPA